MAEDNISIVLGDDHALVRQALRALLEAQPGLSVIGEEADGLRLIDLVERLQPRVLVVDLVMPGLSGLEVTKRVRRSFPGTRVVVLSMMNSELHVREALRNGAHAYVVKDSNAAELLRAIQEAAAGRHYLCPPLSEYALEFYASLATEVPVDPYERLTNREREVLHLAAEGLTNAELGRRLNISPRTAEVHRASVMRKLGLNRSADLIRYAIERGLLPSGRLPRAPAGGFETPPSDSVNRDSVNRAHDRTLESSN